MEQLTTEQKLAKMVEEGRRAFEAYCKAADLPAAERKEDYSITDAIVALMHFADAQGFDGADLLESARGHHEAETAPVEACAKCGKGITQDALECGEVFTDEGEGPEAGRTFNYCSERCMETH